MVEVEKVIVKTEEQKKDIIGFIVTNITAFLVIYILSSLYPFIRDDLVFMNNPIGGGLNTGIVDCARSAWWHYFNWTGKLISIFIVNFLVIQDKSVYNVLNSVAFVILCNTILQFGKRKKYDTALLVAIYVAMWCFVPGFGEVILWCDGSIEYQWMLIPILGYIYLLYCSFNEKEPTLLRTHKFVGSILMLILGFIAGCSLEATGCMLVVGTAVFFISKRIKGKAINSWECVGAVGMFMGFLFLMLAPGNYKRLNVVTDRDSFVGGYAFRIARETYYSARYLIPLVAIWLLFVSYEYVKKIGDAELIGKRRMDYLWHFIKMESNPIFFMLMAFVSIYVMTFSAAFAYRVLLTPMVMILVSTLISFKDIWIICSKRKREMIQKIMNAFLVLMVIFVLTQVFTAALSAKKTGSPIIMETYYTEQFNPADFY